MWHLYHDVERIGVQNPHGLVLEYFQEIKANR